ncbi:MAG: hypothetical protein M3M96_04745 [Candidatus Eremiobacteraeota bacterium]|nr:hypothetical protein [Candidatus Eremiobacteraeota bacterium]
MPKKPTAVELLSSIVDLHSAVSLGFERNDTRFERLEARVTSLAGEMAGFYRRFDTIEGEVSGLHSWMESSDRALML